LTRKIGDDEDFGDDDESSSPSWFSVSTTNGSDTIHSPGCTFINSKYDGNSIVFLNVVDVVFNDVVILLVFPAEAEDWSVVVTAAEEDSDFVIVIATSDCLSANFLLTRTKP
jgi:hypothetical protein